MRLEVEILGEKFTGKYKSAAGKEGTFEMKPASATEEESSGAAPNESASKRRSIRFATADEALKKVEIGTKFMEVVELRGQPFPPFSSGVYALWFSGGGEKGGVLVIFGPTNEVDALP